MAYKTMVTRSHRSEQTRRAKNSACVRAVKFLTAIVLTTAFTCSNASFGADKILHEQVKTDLDTSEISSGARHLLNDLSSEVSTRDIGEQQVTKIAPSELKHFSKKLNIVLTYLDFDVAAFAEVKRKLDAKHDSAMQYNARANVVLSAMSGILPASLIYPSIHPISATVPNTISIAGGGLASILSATALKKASQKGQIQESRLLVDILTDLPTSEVYVNPIYDFLRHSELGDLQLIGKKILSIENGLGSRRSTKSVSWSSHSNTLDWVRAYWKKQFPDTCASIIKNGKDPNVDTKPQQLTSSDIDDRLTMLSQLRVFLECGNLFAQELLAESREQLKQPISLELDRDDSISSITVDTMR